MTSTNRASENGTPAEYEPTGVTTKTPGQDVVANRESRRERRLRRRVARRARMTRARAAWVATSVDAELPEQVQERMPTWARTGRGRVLLSGAAVLALLAWALVFIIITGL
jgi:hypothetical protein